MPAPIKVSFAIAGDKELLRVFSTVEQRVQKLANVEAKAARASEAAATKRAKAGQSAADKTTKAADSALRKQVKAEEAAARRIERIKERSATMAGRYAAKAAQAEIRAQQQVQKAVAKSRMRMAMGAGGAIGRAGRSTLGSVSGIAGGLGMTAGTMMIGSALAENVRLRDQAALLVNASRLRSGKATQSVEGLTSFSQGISTKFGINAGDVMSGLGTVTERAGGAVGLEKAKKDWAELTMIAEAYGASQEDLGAVVAASLNAGIQPGKEMKSLIESLIAMGKEGQIEFRNLGPELPKLVGAMKATELEGAAGIREMVALAQLAVSATVSPEEARTAVARSIDDMGMKAPLLRKAGVNVFGETGKVRATRDLIPDILAAAEKNPSKFGTGVKSPVEALNKVFGVRSKKMTNDLAETFRLAGGGEAGKAAVKEKIAKLSGANLGEGEVATAHAMRMATESKQIAVNMAQFKVEIGKLLPEFSRMLPSLMKATQGFAKLAVWVSKNPFEGLGILFGAKLASELATAAIPGLFQKAITGAMGATYGGTGAGAIGGSKALGAIGAGLAITAAAVTITAAGVTLIDKASVAGEKEGKNLFATSMEAQNLLSKGARGELGAEDRAKLAQKGEVLKAYSERSSFGAVGEVAKDFGVMDAYSPLRSVMQFFRESAKESQGVSAEEAAKQSEQIAAMLASAAKASETIATNLAKGATDTRSGKPPARSP